jgi:hypothetical protein
MLTDYSNILMKFNSIPKHKRRLTFMEISGYPHYENVCSNILQFYLNPSNEHDLKDLVINSLLLEINDKLKIDPDSETIEIFREQKTLKDNRLDLLILTKEYVIGIENKIFHFLNNDLEDYYNTIISKCLGRKPICILLSLNRLTTASDLENLKQNNFINITYEQIFKNIKINLGWYINSGNLYYVNYLTEFMKTIENLNPKTMEDKELWKFFKNYHEPIRSLIDNYNKYIVYLKDKVDQLLESLTTTGFDPWIHNKDGFYTLVNNFLIEEKFQIGIDTNCLVEGWEIQIFGRDDISMNFVNNIMLNDSNLFPNTGNYKVNNQNRIIYKEFETDMPISEISEILVDLMKKIRDNYNSKIIHGMKYNN